MTAFATVAEFLARIDNRFVDQLAAPAAGAPDEVRITAALDDATAELEGWLGRIPEDRRPVAGTLRVHCVKVALYLLTLNRPVADFESIRAAYVDTIDFYKSLVVDAGSAGSGGTSTQPCPAFDDDSLEGFV